VLLLAPTGVTRWRLDGDPRPPGVGSPGISSIGGVGSIGAGSPGAGSPGAGSPGAGSIGAAGQVSRRESALGADQKKLSTANAQLSALRTQAEVLTQRYDQALVNDQQALAAYRITQDRLSSAERSEWVSRRQIGNLAAEQFESGVGLNSASAMLSDVRGPQAYLNQVGLGQVLAEYGADTLAADEANTAIAHVFRMQADDLLVAQEADLRAASDLKRAIRAAVARQLDYVRADKSAANTAAAQLAAAQAYEAALAVAAAQERDTAGGGPAGLAQAPSWAWSSGASATQGDVAADWALSQLGKPYLWGGAGPDSYDCSGLTMEAWARAGVPLLHYTGYQWEEGPHVPLDQLQRGDLVFFATNTSDPATIHHVGIYIGNDMMVDAPYTGASVRIDSIHAPGGLIGAVRPAASG